MSDGFAAMIPARRCFVDEVQTSSFSAVVVRDAINRHSYLGTENKGNDIVISVNAVMRWAKWMQWCAQPVVVCLAVVRC